MKRHAKQFLRVGPVEFFGFSLIGREIYVEPVTYSGPPQRLWEPLKLGTPRGSGGQRDSTAAWARTAGQVLRMLSRPQLVFWGGA